MELKFGSHNMKYIKDNKFEGVLLGKRDKFSDNRGWFSEIYDESWLDVKFTKDNVSRSKPGVLRGLHFQNPNPQGKLVTVLQGYVHDFIVDLRMDSETFGEYGAYEINSSNGYESLYVPEGFAHGFYVKPGDDAIFHYKCTADYSPENEHVLNFFDPELNIDYNFGEIIANKKDLQGKRLSDFKNEELF